MSAQILVTGGTGYIGSHTFVELIEQGYSVKIVDNLSNSKSEIIDGIARITRNKPKLYKSDLRNRDELDNIFKENNIDALKSENCEKIFKEKASGAKSNRLELTKLLEGYFPMQNFEKMFAKRSSVVISPVISPR